MESVSRILNPKASAELIVRRSKDVQIIDEGIETTSKIIYDAVCSGKLSPNRFSEMELNPKESDEKTIDWIFLIDTLNFCFWSKGTTEEVWTVRFHGKTYSGYFALCAGVNRAIEEGMDLTDPRVFGTLTEEDILRIFRSETSASIPLVKQRVENLKEASRVLLEKYEGSFVNCVKASAQSAQKLLAQTIFDFSSYCDQGVFEGYHVSFWKRAQILVGDIWASFQGKGLGYFKDIDSLTMFSDYRVPQVLLYFGSLKYSPELHEILEEGKLLVNGSRHEMEIRGASIHAVELIKEKVKLLLAGTPSNMNSGELDDERRSSIISPDFINSVLIDHFLWDYRREHVEELNKYPYHKKLSKNYILDSTKPGKKKKEKTPLDHNSILVELRLFSSQNGLCSI